MAGKIRGITIELDGDTSGLQKSLKDTNKEIKNTQSQLKDVDKLLKLDPKNTELLRQKQELLGKAIGETEDKLSDLKKAEENMKTKGIDKNSDAFMALQREIIETEQDLKSLKTQADTTTSGIQKIKDVADKVGTSAQTLADKTRGLSTAAAGLVAGLGAMGIKSIQAADDLATLSARTGISTDMLQKFQYASDMVDVSTEELATAFKKMKINMDQNPEAFEAVIRCMKEAGIGYGSVNHPVDRDPVCGYNGIIGEFCPRCGRRAGEGVPASKLKALRASSARTHVAEK